MRAKMGILAIALVLGLGLGAGAVRSEEWNAIREMEKKADQGDLEMQYQLGLWNFWALRSARNFPLALYWFCRAAESGHRASQIHLGMMYWTGNGVERDYLQAYLWFDLAARTAPGIAAEYRERMAREYLTKRDVAMAKALAAAWLRTPQCPVESS